MRLLYIIFVFVFFLNSCSEHSGGLSGKVTKDLELISFCEGISFEEYQSYNLTNLDCVSQLYNETFSSSSSWYEGTDSGTKFNVKSGKYQCTGGDDVNFYVSCHSCPDINIPNFEIEMHIKMINYGNSCSINWGGLKRDKTWEDIYRFGLGDDGKYIITHSKNGEAQVNIKDFTSNSAINKFENNIITIRKIDDWHYFFINSQLVYQTQAISTYGPFISIRIGSESKCEIDNFHYSEIIR